MLAGIVGMILVVAGMILVMLSCPEGKDNEE